MAIGGDAKVTQEIVRSGLRLTPSLNSDLTNIAHEIGMTKNQLMVKILYDWVKRWQNKQKNEKK